MSSINANLYIPVTSTVNNVLSGTKVFAGLALSANPLIPTTNPVLSFASAAAVQAYFGVSSNEYTAATKYFKAFANSKTTAPYMYFGKYIYQAIAPYLYSGAYANTTTALTALQAVTAGDFKITVNGTLYTTSGINLSGDASLSAVAATLQADIWAANPALNSGGLDLTVVYNGPTNQFLITVAGTGSGSTLSFASSTVQSVADLMNLTAANGAVLSQGQGIQTPAQNMATLQAQFTDQFTIFFVDTLNGTMTGAGGDAINLGVAQWVSGQVASGNQYWFAAWSNEAALESASDTTSIFYQITQLAYVNCSVFDEVLYNVSDRVAAVAGGLAALDLSQPNSALTIAFKNQLGLTTSVTDTAIAQIIGINPATGTGKGINYYGNIGVSGTKTNVNAFYGGWMTGPYAFVDNLIANVWTTVQIQTQLLSFFTLVPQIPNDPAGDAQVRAILNGVMSGNVTNGIIGIGEVFSTAINQQLIALGINPQEMTNNGYVIQKTPSTQAQRQARASAPWNIYYVQASAVQQIPVNLNTYF